ncbi:hypothetical protein Bpfe_023127 [Biomphalaria pfeifferi]|uniref:Uncharacterized protein n=1 Tax=Biomphalaria pfeifferi TaxID=112525 RepID=A0AAD8F150_BIOPF|nr:hypothetical protein Bpfe_023127 [Biomphalaria pfeifferi]
MEAVKDDKIGDRTLELNSNEHIMFTQLFSSSQRNSLEMLTVEREEGSPGSRVERMDGFHGPRVVKRLNIFWPR